MSSFQKRLLRAGARMTNTIASLIVHKLMEKCLYGLTSTVFMSLVSQIACAQSSRVEYFMDAIRTNEASIGNADLVVKLDLATADFILLPPGSSKYEGTAEVKISYAIDGSYKAILSGNLIADSAPSQYLLTEDGLMKYYPKIERAYFYPRVGSHPDLTINPVEAIKDSSFRTICDYLALALPDTSMATFTSMDESKMALDYKANLGTGKSVVNVSVIFDHSKRDLPTYFAVYRLNEKLLDVTIDYGDATGARALLPSSWKKTVYDDGRTLFIEKGEVLRSKFLWNSARQTTVLDLPPGTQIVDGVKNEIRQVESKRSSLWLVALATIGFCLLVGFVFSRKVSVK